MGRALGISGMITYTALDERIAHVFVDLSSRLGFPPLIAAYSTLRASSSIGLLHVGRRCAVREARSAICTRTWGERSRDDLGEAPGVLVLVTLLGATLHYPP